MLCLVPTAAFAIDLPEYTENTPDETVTGNYATNYGSIGTFGNSDGGSTIYNNMGRIGKNLGSVITNYGTIDYNYGDVDANYSIITDNYSTNVGGKGTIENNFVTLKNFSGTIVNQYYLLNCDAISDVGFKTGFTENGCISIILSEVSPSGNDEFYILHGGTDDIISPKDSRWKFVVLSGDVKSVELNDGSLRLYDARGPVTLGKELRSISSVPATADNSNVPLLGGLFIAFAAMALLTRKKKA